MHKDTESSEASVERRALRKRIKKFYEYMNVNAFGKCFSFLDPSLRQGRVDEEQYVKSLADFLGYYGSVQPVMMKIDLYRGVEAKQGRQDCAYPLIVWKDAKNVPHLFRERWVKTGGRWYTRVAGLVTPDANGEDEQERRRGQPGE